MYNQTENNTKGYLSLAVTSIVWGTTWVGSRYAVQFIPGLQVSSIRQLCAGSIFLIFFFLKGEKLPTWQQFKWLFMVSIFMFVLNNGLATWCVKYISGGLASLISALYPICTVLLEMLFFKKANSNKLTFLGLLIGIGGVVFVFYENAFHAQPKGYGFGVALCLIAMLAWSLGTIFIARNKYNMNPYYATGWQMFIASFIILFMAQATGNHVPLATIPANVWLAISYLAVMGSVLTFIAFVYTVKHLPAAIASLYAYINPIVAMLVGAWWLHEVLTINLLIGSVITLAGVYIVNYSLKNG